MRRLRKLWASPLRFKALLAEAFARLCMLAALRFSPLPRPGRWFMRPHQVSKARPDGFFAGTPFEEICRAVDVAALFVPGATCLVKAQAGSAMLNRFGYAAAVKIGVLKQSSDLKAHAWVESDGRVVIGNSPNQYVEFPEIEPTASSFELPRA